jgi:VWFA-related protein
MSIDTRACILVAAFLPSFFAASAQQTPPIDSPASRSVHLDVVVETKSGSPVTGLQQQDFTLVDNKATQPITSFKAVSLGQEPVEVILLMDAVNTRFDTVAFERGEVKKFLLANGGKMTFPTSIAVLTDKGTQIQRGFSTDGNALNDALEHDTIGLRQINRSSGIWGANDRLQISLTAIYRLADYASTLRGRKVILWISPGWPLLSGPGIQLGAKQQQQIFNDVVSVSTRLRQANVVLYNINPLGVGESLIRTDYYQEFLKGVRKPSQTAIGNLGLQVLAVQSGGLALESSSDVAGMLKRCLADSESWYQITFDSPVPEQPNEYHHVEIKLDKPEMTVRTRDGYYSQP